MLFQFISTIFSSIARGFGWRLGSDAARGLEHFVQDEFDR